MAERPRRRTLSTPKRVAEQVAHRLENSPSLPGAHSLDGSASPLLSSDKSLQLDAEPSASSVSSSASSSTNPSPCPSILRTSTSSLTLPSTSTTPTSSPNITFAPLPEIEPRKRQSPHPLGVAARSRMLKQRRMLREQGMSAEQIRYMYQHGQMQWQEGGEPVENLSERDRERQAREERKQRERERERTKSDPGVDARMSLGKRLKGVWSKVAHKEGKHKHAGQGAGAEDAGAKPGPEGVSAEAAGRPSGDEGARTASSSSEEPSEEDHVADVAYVVVDEDHDLPDGEDSGWEENHPTPTQRSYTVHNEKEDETPHHLEVDVEQDSWKVLLTMQPSFPSTPTGSFHRASVESLPNTCGRMVPSLEVQPAMATVS